jgi:hypothetical protein
MYINLADIQAEGYSGEESTRITRLINLACSYIDLRTGQWFESREFTSESPMKLDGSGTSTLHIGVPIINITGITIAGEAIDLDSVVIYNRRWPDDRDDPKIVFQRVTSFCRQSRWTKGHQNISITGSFGYMDWNANGIRFTPEPIKQVAIKLVKHELPQILTVVGDDERRMARVISEETDMHSYKLAEVAISGGATGDPEIDDVLALYPAPAYYKVL